jgi:hypothetical protein
MKGKKILTIGLALMAALALLTLAAAGPGQGKRGANAGPPEIEMVTFVNIPYWTSPPWYPPAEETDTYRLVRGGIRWAGDEPLVDCVVYTLDAPDGAFAAVTPAFGEWDGYTPASIYGSVEEDSVTTPPGLTYDGENTACWGPIDGPGGAVAVTRFVFWVNTKELIEFDIVFDIADPWSTDGAEGTFDIQNVMTHELGHTLVLDDLRSPKDGALTMHAYTWSGDSVKRTLGSGDILGIQEIYGE